MHNPKILIRRFLQALEMRDLAAASACLAPEVQMVFPGGTVFTRLEELVEWARPRYQRVAKRIDRMDVGVCEDEFAACSIVMCQGTLHGLWADGRAFEGIRFADWFLLENGLIKQQRVWNDLAEMKAIS